MAKKKKLNDSEISELIDHVMVEGRKRYKAKRYPEAHAILADPIKAVGKKFFKHPRAGEVLMAIADVLFTSGEIEKAFDAYTGAHGVGGSLVPYIQLRQGQIAVDYLENRKIKKFGRLIDKDSGLGWLDCAYMNGGENLMALMPSRHKREFQKHQDECRRLYGTEDTVPDGSLTMEEIATTFADIFRLPKRGQNTTGIKQKADRSPKTIKKKKVRTPTALQRCKAAEQIAKSGDSNSAIKAFELAYELFDEGSRQVQKRLSKGLGELLFQDGKSRKALDPFHDANNLAIDAHVLLRLGQCYFNIRQRKKATEFLLRAYMLEGSSVFKDEDKKYFAYLKSKVEL